MNETRPTKEDLHDAVTDRLLAEAIGGEAPPDQREVILTRATKELAPKPKQPVRRFGLLALAASLLVMASVAVLAPQAPVRVAIQADEAAVEPAAPESPEPPSSIEANPIEVIADENNAPVETASESLSAVAEEPAPADSAAPTPSDQAEAAVVAQDGPRGALGRMNSVPPPGSAPASPPQVALGDGVVSGRRFTSSPSEYADTRDIAAATRRLRSSQVFERSGRGLSATETSELRALQSRVIAAEQKRGSALTPARGEPSLGTDEEMLTLHRRIAELRGRDRYEPIVENPFVTPRGTDALSTFSIDVDTASYANVRQYLTQANRLPPRNAVRIEELVNYFDYDDAGPPLGSETPFAANMEIADCPWNPRHRLVRIGIKGREVKADKRPLSNLVFLVDVSGSMGRPNKLPLLVAGLKRLTRQLGENDRVAIVVYASSEGLALPSTSGADQTTILDALARLAAGGSTAGGAGIELAYRTAEENFIAGGVNRVLLCTDGDFNVGVSDTEALANLVETKAKETGVFLSVLGFGRGNLNDAMMETISGRGNGTYAYIDSDREAHRVLVRQMSGTLVTIAKDVKLQVEFNPQHVARYRLIGYENRVLAAQDFNDDTKDAGEIGAGHTVTALYEIVPVGAVGEVDPLKYQPERAEGSGQTAEGEPSAPISPEMLTLKIRYKQPDGEASTKLEFPLIDGGGSLAAVSEDFRFASAVAEFGLLLRNSQHKGGASYAAVLDRAEASRGADPHGDRAEFVGLVRRATRLPPP